jgi:hypothetical protein
MAIDGCVSVGTTLMEALTAVAWSSVSLNFAQMQIAGI